ncbi:MAG: efflux transporter outer membrane subunit [Sandaracinaceae bacterium]|nr:efflux transporter outer membrane subunit [Sandaracinaceae bacterium]
MRRLALAAALLSSACSPHETASNPRPPFDLPESYTAGGEDASARDDEEAAPDRWWLAFGDPELTYLVDQALAHNFQLGAAWARVEQAESGVQASASGWWPQISASLDASRRRTVAVFGALGRQEFENNSFGMSLPVSYEIDVWNRVGHTVAASGLEVGAARDDVEALAMTLAANVVEAWLELLQQRAAHALLEQQLETNRLYAELVALRFAHGLGTALDIHQQRQQLEATEAQLAQIEGAEQVARQQLALLVGRPPNAFAGNIGSLPEPTTLPPPPAVPREGIPAHLLLSRPDVRAAQRRVEAQDHRVGAAIADLFPNFRFNASIGLSSPTIEGLVSSFVYSIAGSILATILDGGRRDAEIRRNRAVLRERLQMFGHTVLTAMLEVESAIARERQLATQGDNLGEQLEAARSALTESRRRYSEGLSDYLPVLTSLAAVQRLEQSILATQRQRLSQRVQLARALGGAWTGELERPDLPLPRSGDDEDEEEEPAGPEENQ